MALGRGFEALGARMQEAEERRGQSKYRDVFLSKAGSVVKFRYLTEASDAVIADVHTIWTKTQRGKNRPVRVICTENEPGGCAECQSDDEDRRNKRTQTFGWVWVHEYLHSSKPERGESEAVMVGGRQKWRQAAGTVGLYAAGWTVGQQLLGFFAEYGTICDRDYKLERLEKSGKVSYNLIPTDPKPFQVDLEEDLPDLVEFLLESGKEEQQPKAGHTNTGGSVSYGDAADQETPAESPEEYDF